jgi:competence protein ComEC
MAVSQTRKAPTGYADEDIHVAVQRNWRSLKHLSSLALQFDKFLADSSFDRGPWLVVFLGAGVTSWFLLKTPWQWCAAVGAALIVAIFGYRLGVTADGEVRYSYLRQAMIAGGAVFAAGVMLIWMRSELVGAEPIERPRIEYVQGYVLDREDQPAMGRIRLTMAVRDAEIGQARKIRVNLPIKLSSPAISEGAVVRMRVRLMPPAPPMLPGAYNFARRAWFEGLSATGAVLGEVEVIKPSANSGLLASTQRRLSEHVREKVGGSAGAIAAAFASGDRGAIADSDEDAMRDAGLTHLLSISGLHVSAVIAGSYMLILKLMGLWPWLALRARLPLVAASGGALAGIGYTLLTGAEVPTVRSCAAAILVLIALAMGREALSLRMVAVAATFVLLLWPESISGPSFQMSFAAVIAIVSLHNSAPVKAFLAPRAESRLFRTLRRIVMLFVTGFVIEIALMPIVLFHFHRAGVYGAIANVVAIPLVTFISMPLIALALFLDLFGLGFPAWWIAENSLDLLLRIAHMTADQPGAVKLMPQMSHSLFAMFILGGLWIALWTGKRRFFGFVPAAIASLIFAFAPTPDILISRDGDHVGVTTEDGRMLTLRQSRSGYANDNLLELAGVKTSPISMAEWPAAKCSRDFCALTMNRGGKDWHLLAARSRELVDEEELAVACARSDIVVADRWLPRSCRPRWLKADQRLLTQTGGLSLNLSDQTIITVAEREGEHGWWRAQPN